MKNTINKKAIIYCRVSTKEQQNSLIAQEKICRDWASKNNYSIIKVFVEYGKSANTTKRTELTKMTDFCSKNKGKIDAVITYKIDRLSRNTDEYFSLKAIFSKLEISICSVMETIEGNPTNTLIESIYMAFNNYCKQTIINNRHRQLLWKKEQIKRQ